MVILTIVWAPLYYTYPGPIDRLHGATTNYFIDLNGTIFSVHVA
jgi:hypothetical protein